MDHLRAPGGCRRHTHSTSIPLSNLPKTQMDLGSGRSGLALGAQGQLPGRHRPGPGHRRLAWEPCRKGHNRWDGLAPNRTAQAWPSPPTASHTGEGRDREGCVGPAV